jgi:hypothetical protein
MKKILILFITLSVVGCISLEQRYYNSAENIIEHINKGNADRLAEITQTPFLLDGEIIILGSDVKSFWQNIVKADFKVGDPTLIEAVPADEDTYQEFARSMEVETYFKKYISDKGHVIVIETDKFKLLLLMDRIERDRLRIIGFKGPDAL